MVSTLENLDVCRDNSQGPNEMRQWVLVRDPVARNLGISGS